MMTEYYYLIVHDVHTIIGKSCNFVEPNHNKICYKVISLSNYWSPTVWLQIHRNNNIGIQK